MRSSIGISHPPWIRSWTSSVCFSGSTNYAGAASAIWELSAPPLSVRCTPHPDVRVRGEAKVP